jgi:hypothetical protein
MARAGLLLTVVTTFAVLLATPGVAATPPHARVGPIDPARRTLKGAIALATLVALDPRSKLAEFRISCGWYAIRAPASSRNAWLVKGKVRPGLWNVSLRELSFDFESYPNGPISGINHTESLEQWEHSAEAFGWSGHVWVALRNNGEIGDGPTTDICHGVLG